MLSTEGKTNMAKRNPYAILLSGRGKPEAGISFYDPSDPYDSPDNYNDDDDLDREPMPTDLREDMELRDRVGQNFAPFVLTGMPITRNDIEYRKDGTPYFIRQTFHKVMFMQGSIEYGLPFGVDRIVPVALATQALTKGNPCITVKPLRPLLQMFEIEDGGVHRKRFHQGIQRLYRTNILWQERKDYMRRGRRETLTSETRFRFLKGMSWWGKSETEIETITLSDEYWNMLNEHSIPVNLNMLSALKHNPGAFDFCMWMGYRAHQITGKSSGPITLYSKPGHPGLDAQFGYGPLHKNEYYKRKFRERLLGWIEAVKKVWPEDVEWPVEIGNHAIRMKKFDMIPDKDSYYQKRAQWRLEDRAAKAAKKEAREQKKRDRWALRARQEEHGMYNGDVV